MSWINIKGTRASKVKQAPQGREKYLDADTEKISQAPWQVGSILLALALYFKTSLMSFIEAKDTSDEPRPRDEPQLQPSEEGLLAVSAEVEEVKAASEPEENDVVLHPSFASRFYIESSGIFPTNLDYGFQPLSGPHLNSPFEQMMTTGTPVKFPVLPSNDNYTGATGSFAGPISDSDPEDDVDQSDDNDDDTDNGEDPQVQNRRPVVSRSVTLYDQFMCTAVAISLADLLQGATDPDGDVLRVENATVSSGELVRVENGFLFTAQQYGKVTISYNIKDASLGVVQTATFNIVDHLPIVGTEGSDNLVGTQCEDRIVALGGDDLVDGRDGDDQIHGGSGDDHIFGGAGDDVIFGEAGDDVLVGGTGNDTLVGGDGNDRLFGGEGNDVLAGGNGDDQLFDGEDNDHVDGEEGNDTILASADQSGDLFNGGDGVDTLDYAGHTSGLSFNIAAGTVTDRNAVVDQFAGVERFIGGSGDDVITSGQILMVASAVPVTTATEDLNPEADQQASTVPTTVQYFDGGAGFDTLDYSAAQGDLEFDLLNRTVAGDEVSLVSIQNIESFVGGDGNDSFIVGVGEVVLDGRGGNDMFEFLTNTSLESTSGSRHQIVGFEAGDWVRMSRYDIFDEAMDELEDSFEEIYGDGSGQGLRDEQQDQVIPIRVRHEVTDSVQRTYIEADFDNDAIFELSVQLEGNINLVVVTHPTA